MTNATLKRVAFEFSLLGRALPPWLLVLLRFLLVLLRVLSTLASGANGYDTSLLLLHWPWLFAGRVDGHYPLWLSAETLAGCRLQPLRLLIHIVLVDPDLPGPHLHWWHAT